MGEETFGNLDAIKIKRGQNLLKSICSKILKVEKILENHKFLWVNGITAHISRNRVNTDGSYRRKLSKSSVLDTLDLWVEFVY